MTFKEIIIQFETENSFSITKHIASKKGFDLIQGFFEAFNEYKEVINDTDKKYKEFFSGIGYNKIEPEFERIVWNIGWFSERISDLDKHFKKILTGEETKQVVNYMFEILDTQMKFTKYLFDPDFELYHRYFSRLENEIGFNEEPYITFKDFKDHFEEIKRLEDEALKEWVKAQRISGKL